MPQLSAQTKEPEVLTPRTPGADATTNIVGPATPGVRYARKGKLEYDDFTRNWRMYCPERKCGQSWDVGRLESSVLTGHFILCHREAYEGAVLDRA